MKVNAKVTPRASKDSVEYNDELNILKIKTTAAPVDGKANEAVIKLISEYLGVTKSQIKITTGLASKNKIIEVTGDVSSEDLIKRPRLLY